MPVGGRRRALPRQPQNIVLTCLCFARSEKSDEIGGTWNHNRYPGGESAPRLGFGLSALQEGGRPADERFALGDSRV